MHAPRIFTLAALCLTLLLSNATAATTPTKAKGSKAVKKAVPTAPSKPAEDKAISNKKAEARRAQLVKEIATQQRIMDRHDRQSSFQKEKAPHLWVTDEQYAAAKAARDKAQLERDELARHLLN